MTTCNVATCTTRTAVQPFMPLYLRSAALAGLLSSRTARIFSRAAFSSCKARHSVTSCMTVHNHAASVYAGQLCTLAITCCSASSSFVLARPFLRRSCRFSICPMSASASSKLMVSVSSTGSTCTWAWLTMSQLQLGQQPCLHIWQHSQAPSSPCPTRAPHWRPRSSAPPAGVQQPLGYS